MSVAVALSLLCTVTETIDVNVPAADPNATNKRVIHDGFNFTAALNASSSPPASLHAAFQKALSSGAATIDLTALVGTEGATINGNGLAVRAVLFQNPAANANPISLTFGASNPYLLHATGWKITLQPGETYVAFTKSAGTIGSGAKNIDLAGTGSQALNCEIVIG